MIYFAIFVFGIAELFVWQLESHTTTAVTVFYGYYIIEKTISWCNYSVNVLANIPYAKYYKRRRYYGRHVS